MACCKCCCGGVDCTEGQQGKCCCGGVSGTCCGEGEYCCNGACQPEPCCPCENVDASEDCGIESVAFDIDIVFPTCFKGPGYASTVGTGTVVLQASDSFISSADGVSIPNEYSECNFRVDAAMFCASAGESPFGGLAGRWYLNVTVTGGSDPDTRCCNWLCEGTSLASLTVDFPLATNQVGEFCCPAPFDELTVDNSNQIFTNFPVVDCGDWYIRLYNLNIVYA